MSMGDVIAKINTNDKNLNKIWIEYANAYNSGLKKQSKKLMDDLIIQYPIVKEVIFPYLIEKSQQKSPNAMALYVYENR